MSTAACTACSGTWSGTDPEPPRFAPDGRQQSELTAIDTRHGTLRRRDDEDTPLEQQDAHADRNTSCEPRRVLVAGAGRVGTLLGLLRAADGHDVTALRRTADRVPDGLTAVGADLTDRTSLAALAGPFDEVHVTTSADGRDLDAYRTAYVEGTSTLLAHLAEAQDAPALVTFTSSTGVFGTDDGSWVDEGTAPEPSRATAQVLLEAEHLLDEHPWRTCVVRLAGIYGPGSTRLLDRARDGATVPGGDDWTNRIRALDAARALAHVADLDDPAPRCHASDGTPVRRRELMAWLAGLVGGPAPVVDDEAEPRGGKRVDTSLLRSTGWFPAFPDHRVGYAELHSTR